MTTPLPVQEPAGAANNEAWTRAMNAALTYRNHDPEAMDEQDAWVALINALGALASLQPVTQAKSEAVAHLCSEPRDCPVCLRAGRDLRGTQEAVERQPLTGWQPIETAPKDGTTLYLRKAGTVSEGSWLDIPFIEYRDAEGCFIDQQDSDAYWMDQKSGDMLDPTEWMPKVLPEPPGIGPAIQEKQHG